MALQMALRDAEVDDIGALSDLRERFNEQYLRLYNFFQEAAALRYLTSLIAVPKLDPVRCRRGVTPYTTSGALTRRLPWATPRSADAADAVRRHPRPYDAVAPAAAATPARPGAPAGAPACHRPGAHPGAKHAPRTDAAGARLHCRADAGVSTRPRTAKRKLQCPSLT